jgi:hypothetical protein
MAIKIPLIQSPTQGGRGEKSDFAGRWRRRLRGCPGDWRASSSWTWEGRRPAAPVDAHEDVRIHPVNPRPRWSRSIRRVAIEAAHPLGHASCCAAVARELPSDRGPGASWSQGRAGSTASQGARIEEGDRRTESAPAGNRPGATLSRGTVPHTYPARAFDARGRGRRGFGAGSPPWGLAGPFLRGRSPGVTL